MVIILLVMLKCVVIYICLRGWIFEIRDLIHQLFDLFDVVQHVIALLHVKDLYMNEEHVGWILHLIDIVKDFLCPHWFFAILDMSKLVVHPIEADNGYDLLELHLDDEHMVEITNVDKCLRICKDNNKEGDAHTLEEMWY